MIDYQTHIDTALTPKQILVGSGAFTIGVQLGNAGVVADANGKKIVKAGTPIGGATSALTNRQTALVVTNTAGTAATAQGILLHDRDVTSGNVNATLVVTGVVNLARIDADALPVAEVQTALTRIVFIKE